MTFFGKPDSVRKVLVSHLDQFQALLQTGLNLQKHFFNPVFLRIGDCVLLRQGKRSQNRRIRRQHRRCNRRIDALPNEVLVLAWMRLALPRHDPEEFQPNRGMRVDVQPRDPRVGGAHINAEFFVELPGECGLGGFTGFDLAAGESHQPA